MTSLRDSLSLSFGQVAWALSYGRPPDASVLDQLRYLRQLQVPFTEKERKGSGNRMVYRFEHLIECGLGLTAVKRRIRPKDVATTIIKGRKALRTLARSIFDEIDPAEFAAVNDSWRKPSYDPMEERFIWFHDSKSDRPLTIEPLTIAKATDVGQRTIFDAQRLDAAMHMIAFKNAIVSWVGRALVAPETRPGRP